MEPWQLLWQWPKRLVLLEHPHCARHERHGERENAIRLRDGTAQLALSDTVTGATAVAQLCSLIETGVVRGASCPTFRRTLI
jgi:hypothetical protein